MGTRDQAIGPDGTLWVLNDDSYGTDCGAGPCYFVVDIAPDGRVWLSGNTVSAYDGVEWTDYMDDPSFKVVIGFGPEGTAWVQGGEESSDLFAVQPSGEPPVPGPAGEAAASP